MRVTSIVLALPLLALAACGGAGPESAGSVAAPPAGTGTGGSGGSGTGVTPTPSPTPSAGTGGSGTGVTPTPSPTPTPSAGFLSVSSETSFAAIGAMHSFAYTTTNGATSVLYQGNASTVKAPSGMIAYSPRDGVFTLTLADDKAGVTRTTRFQDPAHRSDFNPESTPSLEAPNLAGFNYLSAGTSAEDTTFFYQRPDSTLYVTLAGFAYIGRDTTTGAIIKREHGAFVFGAQTPQTQIPLSGSGTYTGGFLASAVLNSTFDSSSPQPSYLQWITGSSSVTVDFGKSTVAVGLTGTLGPTYWNGTLVADNALIYPSGTTFAASGSATIDLLRTGGFSGSFSSASLGGTAIDFAGISAGSSTAGASSIDGAFFGPNAVNIGGNFRIIGGVPDQRVDIQGAFTGARR